MKRQVDWTSIESNVQCYHHQIKSENRWYSFNRVINSWCNGKQQGKKTVNCIWNGRWRRCQLIDINSIDLPMHSLHITVHIIIIIIYYIYR